MGHEDGAWRTLLQMDRRVRFFHALVPWLIRSGRYLEAQTEEVDLTNSDCLSMQNVNIGSIIERRAQARQHVMITCYEHRRRGQLLQNAQRVFMSDAFRREIARANDNVGILRGTEDFSGQISVPMKVAKGQYSHVATCSCIIRSR